MHQAHSPHPPLPMTQLRTAALCMRVCDVHARVRATKRGRGALVDIARAQQPDFFFQIQRPDKCCHLVTDFRLRAHDLSRFVPGFFEL